MPLFHRITLILLLELISLGARAQQTDSSYTAKRTAPGVKMVTVDGKYQVWTQKVGQGKIKLLLLHGGPANTHEYFENFPEYLGPEGVEIYFYDQLGSYHSDQPKDSSIWTIARFVEEVEQVRQGLGLEQFYLLGHSWGGMLAQEYAAKYQQHLKGLIISNMGHDAKVNNGNRMQQHLLIARSTAQGRALLAERRQDESMSEVHQAVYKQIDQLFNRQHMLRLANEPEPYVRNSRHITRPPNATLYREMHKWSSTARLPALKLPVLLLGAQHDFIPPGTYYAMRRLLPRSEVYICPQGSHFAMWDDPEHYFPALLKFLKQIEHKG